MSGWPYLLLLIPAVPLVWTDFRTRRVALVWLGVLALGALTVGALAAGFQSMLMQTVINIGMLIVIGAVVAGYLCLRGYRLPETFGAGDVVMLGVLTPLFTPAGYLRFLVVACCLGLLWWVVKRSSTIPFVGVMSVVLVGYSVCKTVGLWS